MVGCVSIFLVMSQDFRILPRFHHFQMVEVKRYEGRKLILDQAEKEHQQELLRANSKKRKDADPLQQQRAPKRSGGITELSRHGGFCNPVSLAGFHYGWCISILNARFTLKVASRLVPDGWVELTISG